MQATYFPVSFNGKLGNALEAKKEVIELKKKHGEGLKTSEDIFISEKKEGFNSVAELLKSAQQVEDLGDDSYTLITELAKVARKEAKSSANLEYLEGILQAAMTMLETRKQVAELVKSIEEVAKHNKQLAKEAKQNLKDVGKEAKPLRGAMKQMAKANLEESDEVTGSVKDARKAVSGANDALQQALKTIEGLETKERSARNEYEKAAREKKNEAKETKAKRNKEAKNTYIGTAIILKEARAQALDEAREAYEDAVDKADKVLSEYRDLADHDRDKAKQLEKQIKSMNRQVTKIKLQVRFTRATNLPQLAAATVALGKMGEGATKVVSNGILNTLLKSDFWAGVKAKVAAITAAELFLDEGSTTQKTVMATGLEMNAGKIVYKTEDLNVLTGLEKLDKKVDALDLQA